jgi:hypothetical protein
MVKRSAAPRSVQRTLKAAVVGRSKVDEDILPPYDKKIPV